MASATRHGQRLAVVGRPRPELKLAITRERTTAIARPRLTAVMTPVSTTVRELALTVRLCSRR
jgi:hypothetical protein